MSTRDSLYVCDEPDIHIYKDVVDKMYHIEICYGTVHYVNAILPKEVAKQLAKKLEGLR